MHELSYLTHIQHANQDSLQMTRDLKSILPASLDVSLTAFLQARSQLCLSSSPFSNKRPNRITDQLSSSPSSSTQMSLPPLRLSCSPLLDYAAAHLPLAEDVDSDTTVTSLCIPPQFLVESSAPFCTSKVILTASAASSIATLATTTYPSSRTISLFTRSESCASLSEKALPPLPPCSAPVTTKEIINIMEVLNSFDDDVMKEVARVKENIKDVRELVCKYKTESDTCLEVIAEATASDHVAVWSKEL